jgi:hypothetical protein
MVPMTRRTATSRALLIALFVIGCAGPEPSGSPEANPTSDTSPSPIAPPTEAAATPTAEPTVEPEPTREGTSPPRTGIEINEDIVDRPGVPEALRDNYWWTDSDAGRLGTTAQIGLPTDELIFDVADGLVISVVWYPSAGRHMIVRDFDTGTILREVQANLLVQDAVVIGRRLFWTGMASGGACPEHYTDGGVWSVGIDDGDEPMAIVAPGKTVECGFTGRRLLVSPSGDTLAGVMTSTTVSNWIDVIDVHTLTRRHRVRDAWPWAMTDDAYLQWDNKPSDFMGPGWGMSAYDLSSGDLRWRFPDGSDVDKFAPYPIMAFGSEFIVEYSWRRSEKDFSVIDAVFDPETGERRQLLRQDNPDELLRARLDLSAETHLVLDSGREDWAHRVVFHARSRDRDTDARRIHDRSTLAVYARRLRPRWVTVARRPASKCGGRSS